VKDCVGKLYKKDGKTVKGIGGRYGLTAGAMKSVQGHYGAAIRNNKDNLDQMKADIWAIFYHRSGDHSKCEEWCPAIKDGDFAKADRHRFPDHVLKEIKPVFQALTDDALLTKCLHGGDQNANEAFHKFVWERLPKSTFAGLQRLKIAVAEGVMVFNDGELSRCEMMEYLGYPPGFYNIKHCQQLNELRISQSKRKGTLEAKETRKAVKIAGIAELYRIEEREGIVYERARF
jgi:hypothetical protein